MNNKKGAEYEVFIHAHLCSLDATHIVYLWKKVPEQVLHEANLITDHPSGVRFAQLTSFAVSPKIL